MKKNESCKNCIFFKNKQMLLNYSNDNGFCVNPSFNFNTTDGRLVGVVDLQSLKDREKAIGNPSNDFESYEKFKLKPSRYLLQVSEDFGCNFHKS